MNLVRNALFFVMLVAMFAPQAAAAEADNGPGGFNGIEWGTPKSELKDFFRLKTKGNAAFYSNTKETYFIKGFKPPKALYGFVDGKLFAVYLVIREQGLFDHYEKMLRGRYGEPRASRENATDILRWKSGDVKIKLKKNGGNGAMKLAYYYTPLSEKVDLEAVSATFNEINRKKTDELYQLEQWRRREY